MSHSSIYNLDKCHAIINKRPYILQCKNSKKIGNLCGIHINCSNIRLITDITDNIDNIDIPINNIVNKSPGKIQRQLINQYDNHINKIITIQSHIRGYLVRSNIKYRGIAVYCRHLIKNDSDFLTFENISDIKLDQLFTYIDKNGFYWGFLQQTFKEMLRLNVKNPYNTLEIPVNIIEDFNRLLEKVEKVKPVEIEKVVLNNPVDKIRQKCIEVFQKIDLLKQYTNCDWFLNLDKYQLFELYKQMEDIWNYHVGLSIFDKYKYVNDGKLFTIPLTFVYKLERLKLANILLDDFDRLVSEGQTIDDKTTGALWILSGLTIVSEEARYAMPWLYQSVSII